jgi:putative IMPACT (imprinted ancient) family translation regulator
MSKKIEKMDIQVNFNMMKGGHVDIQWALLSKVNELIDQVNLLIKEREK